jgi:hypothetical protein
MKNETKGIAPLIIAIVVIVVVAGVGVGAYVATRGGGGGGGNTGSATSLQCDVTDTSSGYTLTLKAKDIGSSNMKMRIDMTAPTAMSIIVNGTQQTAWMQYGGTWTDLSSTFSTYWDTWNSSFTGYQTDLAGWTGSGSITVGTVTFSNIQVNPSLDDSLFTH